MRLRRGAKWVFFLLIFAFAFGFLFSGVGGGGGGDVIQQLLGMRGGNPVKSAEKTVKQHPRDAEAWNSLALLYESKGRQTDAIRAYETFLKLKPNDLVGLSQLSAIWRDISTQHWNEYSVVAQDLQDASGPFGLNTDPVQVFIGSSGSNPLLTAYTNTLNTKASAAYSAYLKAATSWESVNRRYLQATPVSDKLARAQAELQLGEAAANANDLKTTITSYKEYLRLVPGSKVAPQVRKALAAAEKANSKG
ncbi:MAG: tetratricopeptide repeat protein [Gaiellaceae bacterium]